MLAKVKSSATIDLHPEVPNLIAVVIKLPETLKKPMYIHIAKDDKQEVEEFKPEIQCHATFKVQLK
jgi:hypothetical protein